MVWWEAGHNYDDLDEEEDGEQNSEDNAITIEKATFNGHCFLDLFPSGGKTTNPTLKIMSNVSNLPSHGHSRHLATYQSVTYISI